MRYQRRRLWAAALCALVLFSSGGCSRRAGPSPPAGEAGGDACWTPQRRYAGEVLAYLIQVVLGRAGDASVRDVWRRRGLDVPLDWARISERMSRPGEEKHALLVLDPNLLGLSHVLYRYDPRLNQFRGRAPFFSPYPSAGLIGLRLFFLQKMDRSEAVRLEGVLRHRALLQDASRPVAPETAREMGMGVGEVRFLQAVFADNPELFDYLEHPFVADALLRMGALADSSAARSASRGARYAGLRPERRVIGAAVPGAEPLRVGVLFSFTDAFLPPESAAPREGPARLSAGADLRRLVRRMEEGIFEAVAAGLPEDRRQALSLVFLRSFERPMAVRPENAAAVADDVVPNVDYVLVVLGKDVYRCLDLGPGGGNRLTGRRAFLDVTDIEYGLWTDDLLLIAGSLRDRWLENGTP